MGANDPLGALLGARCLGHSVLQDNLYYEDTLM